MKICYQASGQIRTTYNVSGVSPSSEPFAFCHDERLTLVSFVIFRVLMLVKTRYIIREFKQGRRQLQTQRQETMI